MEAKQNTPSVIARLMGLDELPPQEPVQKPYRVLSENYLRRVASIGVGKKRSFHERHSSRTTLEEKKESKDVCQVAKLLKGDDHVKLPNEEGKGNLRLSVEKCITGKEFQDSSNFVDSKNGYFQKGIPKRNSLFSNHLHDLHCSLAPSLSGDRALKSSWHRRKSRSQSELGYLRSLQKVENGSVTGTHGQELGLNFHDFVRSQLVTLDDACSSHTRIVVLKPICGKAESFETGFTSPSSNESSHFGDSKCAEFSGPESGKMQVELKDLEDEVEFVRQRSTASREILEELSRRTRWRNTSFSTKVSSLGLRGRDTSAIKSVVFSPPSSCSSGLGKRYQSSSSDKSYLSSEATKQLSKRCLLTEKLKELRPASRSSTLDDFFAKQGHNSRPRCHKPGTGRRGLKGLDLGKFAKQQSKYEAFSTKWHLGLEDSLNWARCKLRKQDSFQKEGSESNDLKHNSEISESIACLNSEGSLSTQDGCVFLDDQQNSLENDPPDQNLMNSQPLSGSSSCSDIEDGNTSQESWVRRKTKNKLEGGNLLKQNVMLPKPPISTVGSVSDMVVDAEKPFEESENERLGPTTCILLEEDYDSGRATDTSVQQESSTGFHEESSVFSHCSGTEPDSLVGFEEAYQPSPVSVLEPPFSSECFGRVKDDICELRQHLELLKSKTSETYSEGSGMMVSSDDETEEGSACDSEENEAFMKVFKVEESRNFSYLVEVLTEAGLHGKNLEEFKTWDSSECPISLSVFETLEKKYGDQPSWKRSERRLLFDRVNAGLIEILLPCMGIPTWEKPVSRRFSSIHDEEMIEEDLWKLLVSQEKERSKDSAENVLGSELGKLDLGGEIYAIGIEIERLLFDELAAEFFSA
ncbi:hypothetical protein PanWU01x14_042970 [Parasponia andersonii]|uniref:DUF4378 domain-containing protein n=1 Tax=Parasponia andersonii TaxID=3476 RepID=A0A2P5DPX2_PARAD|nr:hypothetical protein PanWU01x14_042970 [Parasponia andersonii]